MTTATQAAKSTGPDLRPSIFKFRVMQGDEIIGQFSNIKLATSTADEYRAIVLDVSKDPHVVVYRDGKVLDTK